MEKETNHLLWALFAIVVLSFIAFPTAWVVTSKSVSTGFMKNMDLKQALWNQKSSTIPPYVAESAAEPYIGQAQSSVSSNNYTVIVGNSITVSGKLQQNGTALANQSTLVTVQSGALSANGTMVEGSNGQSFLVKTDSNGQFSLTYTAPMTPGNVILTYQGNGVTGQDTIAVIPNFTVSITASTTNAVAGQPVTITATASRECAPFTLDIFDSSTGQFVASTQSGTTVAYNVTQTATGSQSFVAFVEQAESTSNYFAESSTVTVSWYGATTVSLTGSAVSSQTGNSSVNLTATANRVLASNQSISILDQTTGQTLGSPSNNQTLTETYQLPQGTTNNFIAWLN